MLVGRQAEGQGLAEEEIQVKGPGEQLGRWGFEPREGEKEIGGGGEGGKMRK